MVAMTQAHKLPTSASADAKKAYQEAIRKGATRDIALDLACAAYKAAHPEVKVDRLRAFLRGMLER
jgi:cytochrome c-type biogenesis protein CcmH/NrfG